MEHPNMVKRTEEVNNIIAEYCSYISDLAEDASLNEGSLLLLTEAGRPFTTDDLDVLISSLEKISNNIPREMKNTRKAISRAIDATEDFYVNLTAGRRGYGKKEFAALLSKIESLNDGLRAALRGLGGYTRLLQTKDHAAKMNEADTPPKKRTAYDPEDPESVARAQETAPKTNKAVQGGNVKNAAPAAKTPAASPHRARKDTMYVPPPAEDQKAAAQEKTTQAPAKKTAVDMKNFLLDKEEIQPDTLIKDMFKNTRGLESFRDAIKKTFTEKADDGLMAKVRSKLGMPSLTNWFGMSLSELIADIEVLPVSTAQKLYDDLKGSPNPVPDGLAKQTFNVKSQPKEEESSNAKKDGTLDIADISAKMGFDPAIGLELNSLLRKAGIKTVGAEKLKENFNEEDTIILERWRHLAGMIKEGK
jgi:hypothetical protein